MSRWYRDTNPTGFSLLVNVGYVIDTIRHCDSPSVVSAASHKMESDIHNETDDVQSADVERTAEIGDILRNERRIRVLIELESAGEDGLTVGELADRLAERDYGQHYESEDRKRIYIALYQTHIPTLEAGCILAVDRGICTRGSRFEELVSALARLQGLDRDV